MILTASGFLLTLQTNLQRLLRWKFKLKDFCLTKPRRLLCRISVEERRKELFNDAFKMFYYSQEHAIATAWVALFDWQQYIYCI